METPHHKSILVTGGTGFLGSYLLRYLLHQGFSNIKAIVRPNSSLSLIEEEKEKIDWLEGDVLDLVFLEEALKGVQQVFHCAGVVSFDPKLFTEMMQVNREGTANVVNQCLVEGVEKLVHVSSIAAIGRRPKLKIINEKTKWEISKWNSQYAISKYLGEMEVWRGVAEGLNAAIVNPSVILGGGFWDRGTAQLFMRVWNGLKFYPKGTTGYVDVRDVARFMILLMNSDIKSERFLLNSENWNYKGFFDSVATVLNKKGPTVKVSPILSEMAIWVEWVRSKMTGSSPLITRESAGHVERSFIYQNEKSLEFFDFEYTPIQKTIEDIGEIFLQSETSNTKFGVSPLN